MYKSYLLGRYIGNRKSRWVIQNVSEESSIQIPREKNKVASKFPVPKKERSIQVA